MIGKITGISDVCEEGSGNKFLANLRMMPAPSSTSRNREIDPNGRGNALKPRTNKPTNSLPGAPLGEFLS